MNLIKDWLGNTALEKRIAGMEEVINHLTMHLTEARDNIDKLAEIILASHNISSKADDKVHTKAKKNGK